MHDAMEAEEMEVDVSEMSLVDVIEHAQESMMRSNRTASTMEHTTNLIAAVLAGDEYTRDAMVRILLFNTDAPVNLAYAMLHYMVEHPDSSEDVVEVLGILVRQMIEAGFSDAQLNEVYLTVIQVALSEEMSGTGKGYLLALVVELVLSDQLYADVDSTRHLVEKSFESASEASILALLNNLTSSALLSQTEMDEAKAIINFMFVAFADVPRSYDLTWGQIDLLMSLGLAFYLPEGNSAVYEVANPILYNAVLPMLDSDGLEELLRLLTNHALAQNIGTLPEAHILEGFLTENVDFSNSLYFSCPKLEKETQQLKSLWIKT